MNDVIRAENVCRNNRKTKPEMPPESGAGQSIEAVSVGGFRRKD